MTKIAINGFGRIGRLFFKQIFEEKDIEVIAINDLGNLENLAYLLKYDTVYGRYDKKVQVDADGRKLVVDEKGIAFLQERDPMNLPWKAMDVDIVVEASGAFAGFLKSKMHLDAGAKRVVITAPAKDEDGVLGQTVLMGVNEDRLKSVSITSNGSCTTNASSPVIQILKETLGIEKAILSTVHGYTATQSIVDGPVKGEDFRRGRAAAQNIIPSTTGAAIAVTRAIPELFGKFDGVAMRVPILAGSVADITLVAKRETSVEEVNEIFRNAAKKSQWQGIMNVNEDQIVSSDILGQPYGAIVDLTFTKVVGGNLVKVLSWYDNEAGYTATLVRHVKAVAEFLKQK